MFGERLGAGQPTKRSGSMKRAAAALICACLPLTVTAEDKYKELVVRAEKGPVYTAMLESAAEGWVVRETSKESCTVTFTNKPGWRSLRRLTISAVCFERDDGTIKVLLNDDNNGAHGQGKDEREKYVGKLREKLEKKSPE
jgi:hypothetical protein